jgi:hypothetical protein
MGHLNLQPSPKRQGLLFDLDVVSKWQMRSRGLSMMYLHRSRLMREIDQPWLRCQFLQELVRSLLL